MKIFKASLLSLLLISSMSLAFSSCGDDETCGQSDWTGTYTGDAVVTDDGTDTDADSASVNITASGTENIMVSYSYVVNGAETSITFDPFPASSCNITQTATDPNAGITINLSLSLDGDDLTLESTATGAGINTSVSITASK